MDTVITKEMLKDKCDWLDNKTFIATLYFKDFPKGLLELYSDLIKPEDMENGYLCCEYWLPEDETDTECFVYNFNFEYDTVSVNEYFNKSLYNDIIKELCNENNNTI